MKPRLFKTAEGLRAFMASQRGRALHVIVLHDDACSPSRCVCTPWYRVEELTTENVLEGARLQDEWIRKVAS